MRISSYCQTSTEQEVCGTGGNGVIAWWRSGKPISGTAVVDERTKRLVMRLAGGEIAVIRHRDVDEVAARGLLDAGVRAVVNALPFLSGSYPAEGALLLARSGVPLFEIAESDFARIPEGSRLVLDDGHLWVEETATVLPARRVTDDELERRYRRGVANLENRLAQFIDNTLQFAAKEKAFFIRPLLTPVLRTPLQDRHVLVVVRGSHYRQDLLAIRGYVEDYRPVLIGVDGGADALLDFGWTPDIIIGDMDSVSDRALRCGADLIVHGYPDGRAPGLARLQQLGLSGHVLCAPGTSEDIALLLAYEKGAELIVTVGTHSNMIDFLEKGRQGMASTVLVRMKIGAKLVDARGVSKLYPRRLKWRTLAYLIGAACVPVAALAAVSESLTRLWRLVWVNVKLLMG